MDEDAKTAEQARTPEGASSGDVTGYKPMPLLDAAKAALNELIELQAMYNDALGIEQTVNGVAILLEDAINNAGKVE